MGDRAQWTGFHWWQVALMVLLILTGEVIGLFLYFFASGPLSTIAAQGAVTLFFGALLGGVVTLMIAEFDRRRVRRAAELDFISNVLADLKAVYDRVDRGRTLIRAHRSAKTYGEEMRNFIDARVKLLNVVRALNFDERGVPIAEIRSEVSSMEQYLRELIDEFEHAYKEVSRKQSLYEARMKQALEMPMAASGTAAELPANEPWDAIAKLPSVADLIAPLGDPGGTDVASGYSRRFEDSLDKASDRLRAALHGKLT